MTIREYNPTDRGVVVAHIVEFQEYERLREPGYTPGVEMADTYLDALLRLAATGKMLVAEEDGLIVGYSCFYVDWADCMQEFQQVKISDVYLAPAQRGKGIGRKFLEAAEAFGKENGIEELALNVLWKNVEAQAMYKKCGFREFDVVMVKPI
jgi:ribosomal protein S18 acetylase RimI-like enzyme